MMKRMFGRSEKVRAASRAALEKLRSLSAEELLAIGEKHANSDIAIMLTDSADNYDESSSDTINSQSNKWQTRYYVFKEFYAQGWKIAQEQMVAFESTSTYKIASSVHTSREESLHKYALGENLGLFSANDQVPAPIKCVAA